MIEYLHGQLTEITPALAIVECGGVEGTYSRTYG